MGKWSKWNSAIRFGDEIKFPSFEALKAQIEQDVKQRKRFLQNRIILKHKIGK